MQYLDKNLNRKGAFELSISTVIIIAIGATLLILGLVLVRNIFTGATGTIDLIDRNTKSKINELFNTNDDKVVVYLPSREAEIQKGKRYSVEFGIKNTERGETNPSDFSYTVSVGEVEQGCRGLSVDMATKFIKTGRSGAAIRISPGSDPIERAIVIEIPEDAPLCTILYNIEVRKNTQLYDTEFFNLIIT